jgi:superfamily II DNA/RNA helicase
VGRTARAGQSGIVTSLYTEANRDLVRAVRQAEELAQPVVGFRFHHPLEGYNIYIFSWRSICIIKMLMFKQEGAFSRKRSFRNKLKKQALQKREALLS